MRAALIRDKTAGNAHPHDTRPAAVKTHQSVRSAQFTFSAGDSFAGLPSSFHFGRYAFFTKPSPD